MLSQDFTASPLRLLPSGIHGLAADSSIASGLPAAPLIPRFILKTAKRTEIFSQSLESLLVFSQTSSVGSLVQVPLRTVLLSPGVSPPAVCVAHASLACRVGCRSRAAREPRAGAVEDAGCIIQHRGPQ